MLSHVMIGSRDIERSRAFYNAVLGVLGAPEPIENASTASSFSARIVGVSMIVLVTPIGDVGSVFLMRTYTVELLGTQKWL